MQHILLIEPDALLAKMYAAALGTAGHIVRTCTSAQAAIHYADEVKPDIVILEIQLVGHSGVEFLYEFRSYVDWQNVPLVLLTYIPVGEFAGSRQLLYEELGVRAYLYKPQTSLRSLLRCVNELAPTEQ